MRTKTNHTTTVSVGVCVLVAAVLLWAQPGIPDRFDPQAVVEGLAALARANDRSGIRQRLRELIPDHDGNGTGD